MELRLEPHEENVWEVWADGMLVAFIHSDTNDQRSRQTAPRIKLLGQPIDVHVAGKNKIDDDGIMDVSFGAYGAARYTIDPDSEIDPEWSSKHEVSPLIAQRNGWLPKE